MLNVYTCFSSAQFFFCFRFDSWSLSSTSYVIENVLIQLTDLFAQTSARQEMDRSKSHFRIFGIRIDESCCWPTKGARQGWKGMRLFCNEPTCWVLSDAYFNEQGERNDFIFRAVNR